MLLAGCSNDPTEPATDNRLPLEGVTLRLVIVDDPALAEAIGKLEGEWKALSGSRLKVTQTTQAELLQGDRLGADAVICPSFLLGPLAERDWLVPLPKELVDSDKKSWSDIFEIVRCRESVWGSTPMAVPFGSPVLTCYYRADLLEAIGAEPPKTWADYAQLVEKLADRKTLGKAAPPADQPWNASLEPLGPGWASLVLLARAASVAKHPDNYSTLFDIESMRPLIDSPPMVRALKELVAAAKFGPDDQLALSPSDVRQRFWQGRCALALTWASAAAVLDEKEKPSSDFRVGVVELPGSETVYDVDEGRWKTRGKEDSIHVPLLATTGRLGVVSRHSDHPDGAADFLAWLSSAELNPPPSIRSPDTTLFRRSQARFPKRWVEPPMSLATAGQYADQTQQALSRQQWIFALRIPGRAEYLAALDLAVHRALRDETPPEQALRQAATQWHSITLRLGLESQRRAYLHSLGLEP